MENTENKEPQKKSFNQKLKEAFQIRHFIGLAVGGVAGFA